MQLATLGEKLRAERLRPNLDLLGHGNTALLLAVGKGYTSIDSAGKPLKFSNFQLAEKLLSLGANLNIRCKHGNSPLHLAYLRRDPTMIQLLERSGADPSIKNDSEKTPPEMANVTFQEAKEILASQVGFFYLDTANF